MARSMAAAGAVPHFHFTDELDAGPLLAARDLLAADPALAGARLTFLPFVIKARRAAAGRPPARSRRCSGCSCRRASRMQRCSLGASSGMRRCCKAQSTASDR